MFYLRNKEYYLVIFMKIKEINYFMNDINIIVLISSDLMF